ncbi:MAG: hypothetical protein Q8P11_02250 [bacterium]|nr:hypothetical protein [bacterium]
MDTSDQLSILRDVLYEEGHQALLLLVILKRISHGLPWSDLDQKIQESQQKVAKLLKKI